MTDDTHEHPIRTAAEDFAMAEYLAAEETLEASVGIGDAMRRLADLQRQQLRWWAEDLRATGSDLRDVKDAGDLFALPLRHLERRTGHVLQGTLDSLDVWRDLARSLAEPASSVWRPFQKMVRDDL